MILNDMLKSIWVLLLILFATFPWLAGIVDIAWVFLTTQQATSIPWSSGGGWRVIVGFLWPIAILGLTGAGH